MIDNRIKHIKYKFDLLNLALAEIFKHFSVPTSGFNRLKLIN